MGRFLALLFLTASVSASPPSEPLDVRLGQTGWPAEFDGVPVVFEGYEAGQPTLNAVGYSRSSGGGAA
jgi:hypothetical protein